MKLRTTLFILLFPFIAHVFWSCCSCENTEVFEISTCSFAVEHINNSGEKPVITSEDEIGKNAYGIQLAMEKSESLCFHGKSLFIAPTLNAFKCDCLLDEYIALDTIQDIRVRTVNDFDMEHPAGTDVSEYFFSDQEDVYISISDLMLRINGPNFLYNGSSTFNLLLLTAPMQGVEHQFNIEIDMTDGRSFIEQTDKVDLI